MQQARRARELNSNSSHPTPPPTQHPHTSNTAAGPSRCTQPEILLPTPPSTQAIVGAISCLLSYTIILPSLADSIQVSSQSRAQQTRREQEQVVVQAVHNPDFALYVPQPQADLAAGKHYRNIDDQMIESNFYTKERVKIRNFKMSQILWNLVILWDPVCKPLTFKRRTLISGKIISWPIVYGSKKTIY